MNRKQRRSAKTQNEPAIFAPTTHQEQVASIGLTATVEHGDLKFEPDASLFTDLQKKIVWLDYKAMPEEDRIAQLKEWNPELFTMGWSEKVVLFCAERAALEEMFPDHPKLVAP